MYRVMDFDNFALSGELHDKVTGFYFNLLKNS